MNQFQDGDSVRVMDSPFVSDDIKNKTGFVEKVNEESQLLFIRFNDRRVRSQWIPLQAAA